LGSVNVVNNYRLLDSLIPHCRFYIFVSTVIPRAVNILSRACFLGTFTAGSYLLKTLILHCILSVSAIANYATTAITEVDASILSSSVGRAYG
jgi:hypothetical protein